MIRFLKNHCSSSVQVHALVLFATHRNILHSSSNSSVFGVRLLPSVTGGALSDKQILSNGPVSSTGLLSSFDAVAKNSLVAQSSHSRLPLQGNLEKNGFATRILLSLANSSKLHLCWRELCDCSSCSLSKKKKQYSWQQKILGPYFNCAV